MSRARSAARVAGVGLVLAGVAVALILGPFRRPVERFLVALSEKSYVASGDPLDAAFDGPDAARRQVPVRLVPVAEGFSQPTDVQFPPGESDTALVLEKGGRALWADVRTGETGELHAFDVLVASEQGLLGAAFHPRFPEVADAFFNVVQRAGETDVTRVIRCPLTDSDLRRAHIDGCTVVLEQVQPYQNHNAGQLAFGPDGMLYVGFGDGGLRADPHGAGQDRSTWLGKMLRIDVDGGEPYAVPADNPFVGEAGVRPEIWAWGIRNPWRYAFAPDGRMVLADVGQDLWEEVHVVASGDNLGWSAREGDACFPPADTCAELGTAPIWTYGRDEGASITGGVVPTEGPLAGRYLFADFASGRMWALDLPDRGRAPEPASLGRWPMLPVAFGLDGAGRAYVLGFGRGTLFRIDG